MKISKKAFSYEEMSGRPSWVKAQPSGMSMLGTVLLQPKDDEIQEAYKIYQQEKGGFPGEMTQADLNNYLRVYRYRKGINGRQR